MGLAVRDDVFVSFSWMKSTPGSGVWFVSSARVTARAADLRAAIRAYRSAEYPDVVALRSERLRYGFDLNEVSLRVCHDQSMSDGERSFLQRVERARVELMPRIRELDKRFDVPRNAIVKADGQVFAL